MNSDITVAVGLSGGVDSALAAAVLKEAGYRVFGLTMKIWRGAYRVQEGLKHACYGPGEEEDIAACERLCASLGMDYKVVDLSEEYETCVLEYFRSEYRRGRTPNPCVVCNREMKFGFLADRARAAGFNFDFFATGHYARKAVVDGVNFLRTASDVSKDQTYFLYGLDSERLSQVLFPLGDMSKAEVRRRAKAIGLEVADKPESQDFVAGGDYSPLFADKTPEPGDIVDTEGKVLGRHRGLPYYTIGQRKGIGLSIDSHALYVLRLDAEKNRVVVGPGEGLFAEGLESDDFRFQNPAMASSRLEGVIKIRQNHRPVPCGAEILPTGGAKIVFETPQRAVAPGQSAVLYSADGLVLGGGVIDRVIDRVGAN
ncbi:MAG: tRNA 2-thiouridine(34) synthase MnmA [Rectinema sp.]